MEDQVTAQHPHRRHRAVRKRTPGERFREFIEMPRLTRRDRNQRVVIAGVILLFAAYLAFLAVRPLMNSLFGSRRTSSEAPPATQGLRKR